MAKGRVPSAGNKGYEYTEKIVNQKPLCNMRFTLSTLLALLVATLVFGQQTLQPRSLVSTAKRNATNFERAAFFKASQQGAPAVARQLKSTEFNPLQLDEEALSKALGDRPQALQISLPFPGRQQPLTLELVKVDIFAEGFQVVRASTGQTARVQQGLHYRGIIRGEAQSVAAISLFEGAVMGLISAPKLGNLVLGKLESSRSGMDYLLYRDAEVLKQLEFDCATSDDGPDYKPGQLQMPAVGRSAQDKCTNIYLEIDNDVYQSKGGATGATNYITGLFNEVSTLYANENLSIRMSELFLWDEISPYAGSNSYTLLTQFVDQRPSFNGDLGQLISYQASGGIAYLSGLCSAYSPQHSFSSINANYATVPTYSFSVMVVAHELGHLFGSRHTHACAWNGNNTAIDGCAGYTEGSCPDAGVPADGGTIMSYCHLRSAGINFSKGFGTQPGNVIRNAVTNANCLVVCQPDDDDGNPPGNDNACEGQEVELSITLDIYGIETTWEVRDSTGDLLHEGGPYPNTTNGTVVNESFCLPEGCYDFTIFDAYGDGICCGYGVGKYELRDSSGTLIVNGGEFDTEEQTAFCLPIEDDGTADCDAIDFTAYDILSFGGAQDAGTYELFNESEVLRLQNNAWKAIRVDYDVTPSTVIELEFGSTKQGEIHGIGFDDNENISSNRTFRLYGTQNWGIDDYDEYTGNSNWQKFTIPVGEHYTGVFEYLFFVADHDRWPRNGDALFRNIVIYEKEKCDEENANEEGALIQEDIYEVPEATAAGELFVYPNPAQDGLTVRLQLAQSNTVHVQVFSVAGQLMQQQQWSVGAGQLEEQLDVSRLTPGTYVLKVTADQQQLVQRFTVSRF